MKKIQPKQRKEMEKLPFFNVCALAGYDQGECEGRITWDHPLTFAGSQIIDPNFTVPLCTKHHDVDFHQDGKNYKKELSTWIVLNRSTPEEIRRYSKAVNYERVKTHLNGLYGPYDEGRAIKAYKPSNRPQHLTESKNKPFWVKLPALSRRKVLECMEYYNDRGGTQYDPFKMVEVMIDSCHAVIPKKVSQETKTK